MFSSHVKALQALRESSTTVAATGVPGSHGERRAVGYAGVGPSVGELHPERRTTRASASEKTAPRSARSAGSSSWWNQSKSISPNRSRSTGRNVPAWVGGVRVGVTRLLSLVGPARNARTGATVGAAGPSQAPAHAAASRALR